MKPIKVIDRICGSGKTTWIFAEIKRRSTEKWLYVSPYLKEVGDGRTKGRIQQELPELNFKSPSASNFGGKGASLKTLIMDCENVAISHQLFKSLDKETLQFMYDENYNVVIDETLDVISLYNFNKHDVEMVLKLGLVEEGEHGKLLWTYDSKYSGAFKEVKRMCEMEMLYLYQTGGNERKFFVNKIPPRILECTGDVYILTYRFTGSLMYSWLRINKIQWEYFNPVGGRCPTEVKRKVRELVEVIKPPRSILKLQINKDTGASKQTVFSKSWFENATEDDFETIRKAIDNVINHKFVGLKGDMIYTTFKDYADRIRTSRLERAILGFDVELETDESLDTFVTKNMRASNDYASANKVIHVCNTYPHLVLSNYISYLGDAVSRDEYALSELIQFTFRSAVRAGQPIRLVIFSNRMRQLFQEWLKEET